MATRKFELYKPGDILEIQCNFSNHQFLLGEKVRVYSVDNNNSFNTLYTCEAVSDGARYQIYHKDARLAQSQAEITISELESAVKELKEKLALATAKLKYLKEAKVDTLDETKFKVWQTLKYYENKSLKMEEKVDLITNLMKGA